MIQFNIIGKGFLDVEDDGSIGFKTENQQFRFCDIGLGRSVEFSVPASDWNRSLLGYSENPAEYGEEMRTLYQTQLVYDGGLKDGVLKVTAYEGETFKCVFSMGAKWIEDLQSKKLSDVPLDWPKGVLWSLQNTPVTPAAADWQEGEQLIVYDHGQLIPQYQHSPSVNIAKYLVDTAAVLGINFSTSLDHNYWLIAGSMKGGQTDSATLNVTGANAANVSQSQNYLDVVDIDIEWATANVFGALVGGGSSTTKGFKALQNITMKFPNGMPNNLYLIKWNSKLKQCKTLGGKPHASYYPTSDWPGALDDRTVELKKGDIVFFARRSSVDFVILPYYGFKSTDVYYPLSVSVELDRSDNLALGEIWYIRNNQPDMTFFEFLKSVALATGLELIVDNDGIQLIEGSYGQAPTDFKELKNVVSVDKVSRRVESWGNETLEKIIGFESESYVTNPITAHFVTDTEQVQGISEEKSKFSEGDVGTGKEVVVKDVDMNSTPPKFTGKKWTIAYADPNEKLLCRVDTPSPTGYLDIASNTVCVRARALYPLADFFDLKRTDVWLWRGMAYVWTDAEWTDGVLTLTLQKVSQQYTQSGAE